MYHIQEKKSEKSTKDNFFRSGKCSVLKIAMLTLMLTISSTKIVHADDEIDETVNRMNEWIGNLSSKSCITDQQQQYLSNKLSEIQQEAANGEEHHAKKQLHYLREKLKQISHHCDN